MKNIILFLALGIGFSNCSSSKYAYYFDRYTPESHIPLNVVITNNNEKNLTQNNNAVINSTSSQTQTEILTINTSKMIAIPQMNEIASSHDDGPEKSASTIPEKKLPERSVKKFEPDKEHDESLKRKNGFAIAGFSISITGLILLVSLFVFAGYQILPFIIAGVAVHAIMGSILSFIGINSKKRGLARTGFWIGLGIIGLGIIGSVLLILLKDVSFYLGE
jgi:hypothetical protein